MNAENHDVPPSRLAAALAAEPELISALTDLRTSDAAVRVQVQAVAEAALRRFPDYADLHYHAARAAQASGDLSAAAGHLERALAVNPRYGDALICAARIALERDSPAAAGRARHYLDQALRQGADYPDVHKLLGDTYRAEGSYGAARSAYQRALALHPAYAAARTALLDLPEEKSRGTSDELST